MSAFPRPRVDAPPRPVLLVEPDIHGTAPIPLELAYSGVHDGKHTWSSMTALSGTDRILIDHMPAATSVVFPRRH